MRQILSIFFLAFFTASCASTQGRLVEAPPAYQPPQPAKATEVPKLPAKLDEVQAAVKRVFKDAAILDSSREPSFLVGDFNGDQSQDMAVVIRPAAGKITDMNQEFPPWILKDPFAPRSTNSALRIEESDVLLAVIHGYGVNDWRDPQATQTFLLKNAVGSGMELNKGKDFLTAHTGKRIPRLQGDLIREVVRGVSGYLYYAGPTYSWYDPKTFRGEPAIRLVHPGMMPRDDK
jgi:hypothetical protein